MLAKRRRFVCAAALVSSLMIVVDPAHAWFWQTPTRQSIDAELASDFPSVPVVSVARLQRQLSGETPSVPLLIDARSAEEFAVSHLPGAVHAPSAAAVKRLLDGQSASRAVVLYCSVGVRSARVAQDLMALGVTRVANFQASIFAWANQGLPLKRGGEFTTQVHPFNSKWGVLLNRKLWSHEP